MISNSDNFEFDYLLSQVAVIQVSLKGTFPYEDCRLLLKQMQATRLRKSEAYQDLIPDLDSYLDGVESYSTGAKELLQWDAVKLVSAEHWLKRSFYQTHNKYKPIEWMINQANTPRLYAMLSASDQLRKLLIHLITHLLTAESQQNHSRQDAFLTLA